MSKILSLEEMRALLNVEARKARTMRDFARSIGVSQQYLHDCMKGYGGRNVGISVSRALGYKPVTVYVPIEDGEDLKVRSHPR